MTGRAQNTARGRYAKKAIEVSASGGIQFTDYLATSDLLTASATGLKVAGGLSLSGKTSYITQNSTAVKFPTGIALSGSAKYLTANSTAPIIFPTVGSLPATRVLGGLAFVSAGGKQSLAIHSTGTTWIYFTKTSLLA